MSLPNIRPAGWRGAVCGAALLSGRASSRAVRETRPVEYVVFVRADRPWQNSGIAVRQGEVLYRLAEGAWNDDFGEYGHAGGDPSACRTISLRQRARQQPAAADQRADQQYVGEQANIQVERSGMFSCAATPRFPRAPRGRLR